MTIAVTGPQGTSTMNTQLRSHARSNRARILEQARRLLSIDPETSIEDIAQAAGIARRTLYGHFSGRPALLEALGDEAGEAIRDAISGLPQQIKDPREEFTRFVFAMWPVADRYRMLIALAERHVGPGRVEELIAPAREHATKIIARGQHTGAFHASVPGPVLAAAIDAVNFSLLESLNRGEWDGEPNAAAVTLLIACGVDRDLAQTTVRHCAQPAQAPA